MARVFSSVLHVQLPCFAGISLPSRFIQSFSFCLEVSLILSCLSINHFFSLLIQSQWHIFPQCKQIFHNRLGSDIIFAFLICPARTSEDFQINPYWQQHRLFYEELFSPHSYSGTGKASMNSDPHQLYLWL